MKGTFVGYRKSYKAYIIYVLGERHIEFNIDVKFHEYATFKCSKEIQCDSNMKNHETHMMEDPNFGSPHSIVERENPKESQ